MGLYPNRVKTQLNPTEKLSLQTSDSLPGIGFSLPTPPCKRLAKLRQILTPLPIPLILCH